MAKKRYDVAFAQTGKDGKAYWKQIGAVLQTDKGFSLKLETIPVGWDGWATLFEPKAKESKPEPAQNADLDSDVPF